MGMAKSVLSLEALYLRPRPYCVVFLRHCDVFLQALARLCGAEYVRCNSFRNESEALYQRLLVKTACLQGVEL